MKETKKCSLSGLAFTIEDDAYVTLKEYLDSLKKAYSKDPDGSEIIADIEARIVELILSAQDSERVVERPLIMNIIAQLGTAEDIREESAVDEEDSTRTPQGEPRIPRRLYRDMENARLGGVCAGIAKYFNIETAWVRLACFVPLLLEFMSSAIPFMSWFNALGGNLFGCIVLSYLIMWIAVPAARTARQKLEANGEKITVQSIRDASAGGNNNDTDRVARPVIAETVTVFGRILIFLLKMLAALIVFGLTIVALALFMGLCVLLFGNFNLGDIGGPASVLMSVAHGKLIAILCVSIVFIPVIILVYLLGCLIFGAKLNRWVLFVMFLLWIVSMVALPVIAVRDNLPKIHSNYTYNHAEYTSEHNRLQDSIEREAEQYVLPAADTVFVTHTSNDSLPSIDLD